jgi:hypothetical protein
MYYLSKSNKNNKEKRVLFLHQTVQQELNTAKSSVNVEKIIDFFLVLHDHKHSGKESFF